MTRMIYKYTLIETEEQALVLPREARLLSVDIQRGQICLWALVDPETRMMERWSVRILGTGHEIKGVEEEYISASVFVGTVLMHGGALVWHVFAKRVSG